MTETSSCKSMRWRGGQHGLENNPCGATHRSLQAMAAAARHAPSRIHRTGGVCQPRRSDTLEGLGEKAVWICLKKLIRRCASPDPASRRRYICQCTTHTQDAPELHTREPGHHAFSFGSWIAANARSCQGGAQTDRF
jgi:hypothetical protein